MEKHTKTKDYTKMPQKTKEATIRIIPFNLFILNLY